MDSGITIGIDISKKDVLVGIWNEITNSASAVSPVEISQGEIIPAVITQKSDGTWLIGNAAKKYSEANVNPGLVLVKDVFGLENDIAFEIGSGIYKSFDLEEIYIRELLAFLTEKYDGKKIEYLGITGEKLDISFQKELCRILDGFGYERSHVFFITHADAFLWYETSNMDGSQKEMRDVMTADYTSEGLMCYVLINGRRSRNVRFIEVRNCFNQIKADIDDVVCTEKLFEEEVVQVMSHYDISRLYVTGYHIEENWMKNVLQRFSLDRRVFCGRSLYVEGACCMAAIQRIPEGLIGEFGLVHEMSMKCFCGADSKKIIIAKPSEDYRLVDNSVRLILDDTNEIELEFADMRNKDVISCVFTLDGLVAREERTLQVEMNVRYTNRQSVVIKVKDLGFGDYYKTSHRVWEQVVTFA